MTTPTGEKNQATETKAAKLVISGDTVTGYAVLGCLVAGTVGVLRAVMDDGLSAAACLLAAVAAFGTVCYVYLRQG